MKFFQKYGTRSIEVRRAKREFFMRLTMVVAVLMFFALMIVLGRMRPGLHDADAAHLAEQAAAGDPLKNPQLQRLRADVDALMLRYSAIAAERPVDPDDLKLVEQAIQVQREIIRQRGSEIAPKADLERLEELLAVFDREMGGFLLAQSLRQEEEALALWEQRQYAEAQALMAKAVNTQEEINSQYPRSPARDPARLHQLANLVIVWETQPLAEQADELRNQAFALVAQRRYAEARERMQAALDQQRAINEGYRNSRFASIARLKQFEESMRTVQTAEDADRVKELLAAGREALTADRFEQAIALAEEAVTLHRRVMAQYSTTTQEQQALLDQAEILRDTAASLPGYRRITSLSQQTRAALRGRDIGAFNSLVAEWLRETEAFQRGFTRSEYMAKVDAGEISFLYSRREAVPSILELVYTNLLPIPGNADWSLYRIEVPQELFTSVTGRNPSISSNPQLPVDSVTWEEAVDFTVKLAWILARPVSLPTQTDYRDVIGKVELEEVAETSWSSDNTNRESQPVATTKPNPAGFYDLLGNVSEWVASPGIPERVTAIGGSARDSRMRLTAVPDESREPQERNRYVGFRFKVDMRLQPE